VKSVLLCVTVALKTIYVLIDADRNSLEPRRR
jgi:hypothetical protein